VNRWDHKCTEKRQIFVTISLDDTKHEFCYFGFVVEGTGEPDYQIVMLHTTLTHTVFCSIDI